jgi:ceramide glucosyltransferase
LIGALNRQIRWNKIRFAFSKTTYTSEFLANPFPLALMAWVAASFFAPQAFPIVSLFLGSAILARLLQATALAIITKYKITWLQISLTVVKDILQFFAQFAPFLSNEITWRNHRARIGPGTVLLPLRLDASQTPVSLKTKPL